MCTVTSEKSDSEAAVRERTRGTPRSGITATARLISVASAARGLSIGGLEQGALEVSRFRNRDDLGMVERLGRDGAQDHASSGRCRGVLEHLEKERLGHMVAAAR